MVSQALLDRLINLSYQRSLTGFEDALAKVMELFELHAWACLFPPSFNAGGRHLMVGRGIKKGDHISHDLLLEITQSNGQEKGKIEMSLIRLARLLSTSPDLRFKIITLSRPNKSRFVLVLYRKSRDFDQTEIEAATHIGRHLDHCFVLLSQQQEQEFMVGLFRLVSNLYAEGICLLDSQKHLVFENTRFREHLHVWEHGENARNLSLPRHTSLPKDWLKACDKAFEIFEENAFTMASARLAITQGPLVRLELPVSPSESVTGAVRYLALKSSLGVIPYLLLTSGIEKRASPQAETLAQISSRSGFSRREEEVSELIMEGASGAEISQALNISLPTVKTHIRNILRKTGVKTRLEFIGLCNKM